MAELVDARDLKSLGTCGCASSILAPGTNKTIRANTFKQEVCWPFSFFIFSILWLSIIESKNFIVFSLYSFDNLNFLDIIIVTNKYIIPKSPSANGGPTIRRNTNVRFYLPGN